MQRSFYAFQKAGTIPGLHERRAALLAEAAALALDETGASISPELTQAHALRSARRRLHSRALAIALSPKHSLRFLQPGRLVHVVLPGAETPPERDVADSREDTSLSGRW